MGGSDGRFAARDKRSPEDSVDIGYARCALKELAMGTVAHPVGVRAEGQEGGLGAEGAQEFVFGLGVGGGARFV